MTRVTHIDITKQQHLLERNVLLTKKSISELCEAGETSVFVLLNFVFQFALPVFNI